MDDILFSIVCPAYNEAQNLESLRDEINKTLKKYNYELIIVNDGSCDNSLEIMKSLADKYSEVKILDLTRNFGHEAATSAGIKHAKGDAIIVLDADLQDPPELIPEMIEKWNEGFDVVYGTRRSRDGETSIKRITSKLFYKVLNYFSDISLPLNTGDFRLMDRKVVNEFNKLKEKNRFFRGLVTWVGYNQTGIKFDRHKRNSGKSKYNYLKLIKLALDSITSFSTKPLSFITLTGILLSTLSFILGLLFIVIKIFFEFPVSGWTSLIVTLLFLFGYQIFAIGIVGEYIARMFIEVKDRPLYIVKEFYKGENEHE